jgi:hypothetical protein
VAHVFSLFEVLPPVAKDRHAGIVHPLDLDHIGPRRASPGQYLARLRLFA